MDAREGQRVSSATSRWSSPDTCIAGEDGGKGQGKWEGRTGGRKDSFYVKVDLTKKGQAHAKVVGGVEGRAGRGGRREARREARGMCPAARLAGQHRQGLSLKELSVAAARFCIQLAFLIVLMSFPVRSSV